MSSEGELSPGDTTLFADVLAIYDDVLAEVEQRLESVVSDFARRESLVVSVTTRVKTTTTVREKLRRMSELPLSDVHDLAGVRLTADMNRVQQDRLGADITRAFADDARPPRLVDRRLRPSAGYRALHVIVYPDRIPCEIQIRTVGQDSWAQLVEKLGDKWGRGIRYGEMPPEPDRVAIGTISRSRFFEIVQKWGEQLDWHEESEATNVRVHDSLLRLEADYFELGEAADPDLVSQIRDLKGEVESAQTNTERERSALLSVLEELASMMDGMK